MSAEAENIADEAEHHLTIAEISKREVARQISELHWMVEYYSGKPFAKALQQFRDLVELGIIVKEEDDDIER